MLAARVGEQGRHQKMTVKTEQRVLCCGPGQEVQFVLISRKNPNIDCTEGSVTLLHCNLTL